MNFRSSLFSCLQSAKAPVAGIAALFCLFGSQSAMAACTQWPTAATVTIHNAGTPYGPQSVDICNGGIITFFNNGSGQKWKIKTIPSSPSFPVITLPDNASLPTPSLAVGNYEYKIKGTNGQPDFVVHGHIIVH